MVEPAIIFGSGSDLKKLFLVIPSCTVIYIVDDNMRVWVVEVLHCALNVLSTASIPRNLTISKKLAPPNGREPPSIPGKIFFWSLPQVWMAIRYV